VGVVGKEEDPVESGNDCSTDGEADNVSKPSNTVSYYNAFIYRIIHQVKLVQAVVIKEK